MKKDIILIIIMLIYVNTQNKTHANTTEKMLGGWITYDQQLGTLDNKFITFGGGNFGISILGITLGVGIYGNFPFEKQFDVYQDQIQIYYGGAIIGYKTKWPVIGIRSWILLGGGVFRVFSDFEPQSGNHFVIAPSIYLDISLYKSLVLSFGITYRYFSNTTGKYYIDINKASNAVAGNISLGWVY